MRNAAHTIEALERKAADSAVTTAERDALLTKAAELRERHEPQTCASAPPRPPSPPRPPAPPTAGCPGQQPFRFTATNSSTTNTASNLRASFGFVTVTWGVNA